MLLASALARKASRRLEQDNQNHRARGENGERTDAVCCSINASGPFTGYFPCPSHSLAFPILILWVKKEAEAGKATSAPSERLHRTTRVGRRKRAMLCPFVTMISSPGSPRRDLLAGFRPARIDRRSLRSPTAASFQRLCRSSRITEFKEYQWPN